MARRSSRTPGPRTLALGAAGAALAAATLGLIARRVRPALARRRKPAQQTWSCECGQSFRVSGAGRHRVFWLPDAAHNDPLLTPVCPSCERPLPTH